MHQKSFGVPGSAWTHWDGAPQALWLDLWGEEREMERGRVGTGEGKGGESGEKSSREGENKRGM